MPIKINFESVSVQAQMRIFVKAVRKMQKLYKVFYSAKHEITR